MEIIKGIPAAHHSSTYLYNTCSCSSSKITHFQGRPFPFLLRSPLSVCQDKQLRVKSNPKFPAPVQKHNSSQDLSHLIKVFNRQLWWDQEQRLN